MTLQATGLAKAYGGTVACADVDLAVVPGEVVGLLGPNGAGKSTTLRLCAQAATPDAGTITVDAGSGPVSTRDDARFVRRHVAYVPDHGGLFPRLTGWEHLELAARLWGRRDWQDQGRDLFERLELTEAADRRTSGYSHGMGRRLAVAVAVIADTGVLILDEPFDGVDPAGVYAIRSLIRERADAGVAVCCSTHLLDAAARTCDRLNVIAHGRTVMTGPVADVAAIGGGDLEAAYLDLVARP